MRVHLIAAGALMCAAALVSLPAQAQPKQPKLGERISTTACPYAGVTATCLMINGADGTVFNITGANPKPRLSARMIRLRGTVTDKVSMCNQGVVLERVRWTRTRQRCPN